MGTDTAASAAASEKFVGLVRVGATNGEVQFGKTTAFSGGQRSGAQHFAVPPMHFSIGV